MLKDGRKDAPHAPRHESRARRPRLPAPPRTTPKAYFKPHETTLTICAPNRFRFWTPPAEIARAIRSRWPRMTVLDLPDIPALERELPKTDIFIGLRLLPAQFAAARKLKWIHCPAAAVGQWMFPELRASDMVLTNGRGIQSGTMGEHVLGTLIALARRFPDCVRHQQQRKWAQRELWDEARVKPRELRGQTLLLIGFGEIGRAVARLAAPLGMRILAVTRSGRDPGGHLAETVLPVTQLRNVLPQAGFIVLAAPETEETRGMIGAAEFALMKPSAYFVNVARGSLVDEPALIEALARGQIAGAALDVASQEPLPPESPLWKLDNAFLTPHVSAVSERFWERQSELLIENLVRWFTGRELLNRVDLARGY